LVLDLKKKKASSQESSSTPARELAEPGIDMALSTTLDKRMMKEEVC
jgi:hypothetical protein